MKKKKKKIVAIGCGGAGMFSLVVASQLRKGKFETVVLSDEPDIYCRCTSSYILSGEAELDDAIQPESMVCDYGLEIVHDKALRIDQTQQRVETESGASYPYDSLVIATGARASRPPIRGIDGKKIYTVRTSDDIRLIEETAKEAKTAVVIGAGVIGIEVSGALKARGVDVHLVENTGSVAASIAEKEFADKIVEHLRANGLKLYFDTKVSEIRDGADGRKEIVIEKQGSTTRSIAADMIVVAVGVTPNLEIIKGTDIESAKQGILVDEKMQTSVKGIYACGDCCFPFSAVTKERVPSALASLAIQQSKIVGFQIAGFPIKYAGSTGAFAFKVFGKDYAGAGLTEEAARKRFRWVVVGRAETTDVYNDLKGKQPLSVKLIFAGPFMRLVGYEAWGNGVMPSASVASFAIGQRTNIIKMLRYNYIAHPSLSPWPFMDPIIMATEDAMNAIMKNVKAFFRIQ
jgi:NADPH-dependent 2,4-dienoyl-CoA reductase/sulfur reductase-like enzyme